MTTVLRHRLLQIVCRTDVGLGEAYMAGDYLADDLGGFMALMVSMSRGGVRCQGGISGGPISALVGEPVSGYDL